jgi:hypothetical protein
MILKQAQLVTDPVGWYYRIMYKGRISILGDEGCKWFVEGIIIEFDLENCTEKEYQCGRSNIMRILKRGRNLGREVVQRYEEGASLSCDFAGVGTGNSSLSLRICHRAFQNLVIGEMAMETWNNSSGLAF